MLVELWGQLAAAAAIVTATAAQLDVARPRAGHPHHITEYICNRSYLSIYICIYTYLYVLLGI